MSTARRVDLAAGVAVCLVGVVGLWGTKDIFVPANFNDALGPRTFPMVISAAIVALGLLLIARTALRGSSHESEPGSVRCLMTLTGAIAAYVALFQPLGFAVATVLFLTFLFAYLGERRWWLIVVSAVLVAAAVTLVFSEGLNVRLPTGVWGF